MTSEHTYISHSNVNQTVDHAITLFYASYTVPVTRHCIYNSQQNYPLNRLKVSAWLVSSNLVEIIKIRSPLFFINGS